MQPKIKNLEILERYLNCGSATAVLYIIEIDLESKAFEAAMLLKQIQCEAGGR